MCRASTPTDVPCELVGLPGPLRPQLTTRRGSLDCLRPAELHAPDEQRKLLRLRPSEIRLSSLRGSPCTSCPDPARRLSVSARESRLPEGPGPGGRRLRRPLFPSIAPPLALLSRSLLHRHRGDPGAGARGVGDRHRPRAHRHLPPPGFLSGSCRHPRGGDRRTRPDTRRGGHHPLARRNLAGARRDLHVSSRGLPARDPSRETARTDLAEACLLLPVAKPGLSAVSRRRLHDLPSHLRRSRQATRHLRRRSHLDRARLRAPPVVSSGVLLPADAGHLRSGPRRPDPLRDLRIPGLPPDLRSVPRHRWNPAPVRLQSPPHQSQLLHGHQLHRLLEAHQYLLEGLHDEVLLQPSLHASAQARHHPGTRRGHDGHPHHQLAAPLLPVVLAQGDLPPHGSGRRLLGNFRHRHGCQHGLRDEVRPPAESDQTEDHLADHRGPCPESRSDVRHDQHPLVVLDDRGRSSLVRYVAGCRQRQRRQQNPWPSWSAAASSSSWLWPLHPSGRAPPTRSSPSRSMEPWRLQLCC